MATLPQILEDDVECLNGVLHELIIKSDASHALIIDKGGFIITQFGDQTDFDAVTLADVQRVAVERLNNEALTLLVVGDRAAIESDLKNIGPEVVVITGNE